MPDRSETMNCESALDRLEAYVDGDLEDPRRLAIATHLESCPSCAAEHRLAVAVQTGLRQLPELDPPVDLIADILQQAELSRSGRPGLLSWRPRRRVGPQLVAPQRALSRRNPLCRGLLAAAILATAVIGGGLVVNWGMVTDSRSDPNSTHDVASQPPTPDPAEIAQATSEARYALAYLSRVSRKTGLELKNDLLIERLARPTARSLTRSLSTPRARELKSDAARRRNRS